MISPRFILTTSLVAAAIMFASECAWAANSNEPLDYNRDIRPILSDNCFHCHGPDPTDRAADLRLDLRTDEGDVRGAESVLDSGNLLDSELINRITSDDPDARMPPFDSGKTLTPDQIKILSTWVEQGAKYQKHWAFVPPQRPAVPAVKNKGWVRNPIDAFVLARLEREGLEPSSRANSTTLLRRLSLDLIGLPPTLEELARFDQNAGEKGCDAETERLIASPHFGERWGRLWLDVARYADSDGFEKDKPRFVWMYRDWVINSINKDLPYNQFIIDQIGGDLLPHPTQDQLVATGFLRNSMINEEGGIDPEQFRMEAMYDRMDAVGKGILGLTIQCAQCHTHKYDPLTHTEYYQMFAFLNNCDEAQISAYTRDQQADWQATEKLIHGIEDRLRTANPDWPERMAAWEESLRNDQPEWTIVRPSLDASGGQKHYLLDNGSVLAAGYAPANHTTEFVVETKSPKVTAVQLELLNDPNLPNGGPGRSIYGTCALTEFKVEAVPLDHADKPLKFKIASATSDVNPPRQLLGKAFNHRAKAQHVIGPIGYATDGNKKTAWGISIGPGRSNVPRKAVFAFDKPLESAAGVKLTFTLAQNHGGEDSNANQNNNLGCFRFSITNAMNPVADQVPVDVRTILQKPVAQRTADETARVFSHWRTTVAEWDEENRRLEALWQSHPQGTTQLALAERTTLRSTHRLDRGNFLAPAEVVTPGVPAFLHPLETQEELEHAIPNRVVSASKVARKSADQGVRGSPAPALAATLGFQPTENANLTIENVAATTATSSTGTVTDAPTRLDFARWLVDRKSPTTARAIINRIWQAYFGIGLVATAEDLGTQGDPASNQELLDWLAVELMDNNWSLKHIHRLIVSSATYRQLSKVTPEMLERDPDNRLLARGARYREDAEIVRDTALTASGLLSPTVGGPSVCPPAPAFLFRPPASYGLKTWIVATGPDRYRRGIYTFRFRSVPHPALQTFDAPIGEVSCARRSRSNTPLQALTTLNEPLFVECARALALTMVQDGGTTDSERLGTGVKRCLSRDPRSAELKVLQTFLDRQRTRFADAAVDPWPLLADDETTKKKLSAALSSDMTPADLAAWTATARVILNLDETITKE